ncbi:ATP-binding cassette domain-containing protein [Dactylosporangium sp. CA-139114]|uniref:ATP-binding cassette domain-containing protein n=1 Tax=Dactylosporangium sp. CA-139114 TaxID=3239931 RepID=UPI003D986676
MRLIRDLWATSPRRTVAVALLIVLGAAGQAAASAVGGSVLIHRSWAMFGVLAAALAAAVLTDLAVGLIMARLTADWCADVRRRLCRVAFGQDLPTLETTPVGELLDRIDNDVYQVGGEMRNAGVRIAQSACYTVLSIGTALFVWWPAGVAMIVIVVGLTIGLRKPTSKIAASRMGEEEAWSDLAAVMEESIHGQDDVRTSLARPYVLRLFARRAAAVLERGRRVWVRSAAVTSVASGFVRLTIALIVLGGVWALATDRIDVARLSAIWLLALGFGGTVEQTSRMVPDLQYALGAWARVQLLRDAAQEPIGGAMPAAGDLEVRELTFRYSETARKPALRDVTLTFARGRSYALIGRTGSGKSTLAKVLTRAVDIPRGSVYLGGTDLLELDLEHLRRWIAVVPQRTEILAGTLAENIALFDPGLLGAAARAVDELGLTGWVAELPEGLDTRLGDGGHMLSAGQEQLVAFARIVVRDPQVVILDEATARLDPVTEAQVQRATARLLAGRIGIIVAHRLSSVQQCDEVVVLADGAVVEAGPLASSERFAALLAASTFERPASSAGAGAVVVSSAGIKADPPPLPSVPRARTLWNIFRLTMNDRRFGLVSVVVFALMMLVALDGSVLPWLWADLVDGIGDALWPALGITAALLVPMALPYYTGKWFPEWWVRQLLRISLRLVHGQTGARRVSKHTPAEVVAQGGDTERVVMLADHLIDQWICLWAIVTMTIVAGSFVPAGFMAATIVLSGLAAALFGPALKRSAQRTVAARAAFATALVSSLSAARTVKLAGATVPVLEHLAKLDRVRSLRVRREIAVQIWARSTPALASGLLPIGAWALLLSGRLSAGATLVAVSTLGSARWFAWTTASLVSQLPSARVWTRRTVEMVGNGEYAAAVPGVDLSAGTAPAPPTAPRHPLRRLELAGFAAVHEDGTVAVRDLDLAVERGQLVLVVGPVGSGKSSLLRALAGIVHHTGKLRWNGEAVTEPEMFLRPNQIGYVAQLPRVLSGTIADNIALGHEVDADSAVSTAQLEHDLAAAGSGLGLLIGHKGTRLSGGQLQRLALARALAPRTELLIADDVSSALDVTTELALWQALREHGVTVIGSTSKRAALTQADRVVVLKDGTAAAQGTWRELEPDWGHLAG